MVSATEIFLEYVCPTLGGVIGTVMFAAPLRDVYRAAGIGSLGDLNPTPWIFMLGNCYGWIMYGILIRNFFVYAANVPGFLFAIWLNLKAVELLSGEATGLRESLVTALLMRQLHSDNSSEASQGNREIIATSDDFMQGEQDSLDAEIATVQAKHFAARRSGPHEILVMSITIIWFALTSLLVFSREFDQSTKELIVGCTVNLNLVFFYAAPLSTIWTVLRTQSSATIHVPTMFASTANGTFWCAYGIAVQNFFILVPNGLGALLGGVQILLCVLFPRKHQPQQKTFSIATAATEVAPSRLVASPTTIIIEDGSAR